MPTVDPAIARFSRVEALLDEALDLPEQARADYLEQACGDDTELQAEVRSLLHAAEVSEGFLEHRQVSHRDMSDQSIGPWRVKHRLGVGGMGEVWLAERADGRFEQKVAVKLLHRADPQEAISLLREQRLLARLQHPGIAQLIDAGTLSSGRPYMVMEYVEGTPLLQYAHALPLEARLGLFLQMCEAVAFAHRHLIVHRDLKPENILVRQDGRVALLDFGIARSLDAEPGQTRDLRMTPRYAAPEQIEGQPQTTLTDVYALGLLLHELLTGHSPWGELVGNGPIALLQRARSGPPPAPSASVPIAEARRLRGDLDAIVSKALRPEPGERYVSVDALDRDVRAYLVHAPVAARGGALGYRVRRLLRRYWLAAAVTIGVFLGLVAALSAISLARYEAVVERDIAQTEARRSKAVRDYLAHMFRDAGQRAQQGTPLTAKEVLDQAAARVAADFSRDPATSADVLKALGELHFYIDDYAAAAPLLRRWLSHEAVIGNPVAAADVRFTLAETVHRMGDRDEARALLDEAQAYWETQPERHADVLLTSRTLQARLQREAGEVDAALRTLQAALPQRLRRSGHEHFETAALYTNLGAAYMQAGRIDEGIAASQQAMMLWRALDLGGGNDALNTLNNLAAAQFRKGDLVAAETAFAEALELRRSLLGPSAATAALIGNYARVLQRLERHDEALEYAGEAEGMARVHAGPASPLTQAARITRAELLLALQRPLDAVGLMDGFAAEEIAAAPASLRLRLALVLAEGHQRLGDVARVRQHLSEASTLLTDGGPERDAFQARITALKKRLAH